ncbi:MAG: hypothetical protein IT346_03390 [Epsilonproteobacteria bacterium]|nr:hypothetical protein [Campylobacterota bacterium]
MKFLNITKITLSVVAVLCLGTELSIVASMFVRPVKSSAQTATRAGSRVLYMPKRAMGTGRISATGHGSEEQQDYDRRKKLGLLTPEEWLKKQQLANTYEIRKLTKKLTPEELALDKEHNERIEKEWEQQERREKEEREAKKSMSRWARFVQWFGSLRR